MSTLSQEEIEKRVSIVGNNEYSVLGRYQKMTAPLLIRHNICGHEWEITMSDFLLKKHGCPKCFGEKRKSILSKTNSEFQAELKEIWGNEYSNINPYIKGHEKLLFIHNSCGTQFMMEPRQILHKTGDGCCPCPTCRINANKLKIEEVQNRIQTIGKGRYTLIGSSYESINDKMTIRHLDCNKDFQMSLKVFQQGGRCPFCFSTISKGEQRIIEILKENHIIYKKEICFPSLKSARGGNLRFDFGIYDENNNLIRLIEFDGPQHFKKWDYRQSQEDFDNLQVNDWIKDNYCIKNKIPLARIKFDEDYDIHTLLKRNTVANYSACDYISIDQATVSGIAIWEKDKLQDYFSFKCDKNLSDSKRLEEFYDYFFMLFKERRPTKVFFENILGPEETGKSFRTYQVLSWYQAMLILICSRLVLPYEIINSNSWKKHFGVQGNSRQQQKQSCKNIVNQYFHVDSEDICDAIGLGYYAIEKERRENEVSAF